MRFTHHAKLLALGAALAGLVIVPSIGEVSTATGEPACGPIVSIGGNDFHQVSTEQQLREVARGSENCEPRSNYLLTNDITLEGGDWTPIPNLGGPTSGDDLFGVFDGGGHTISGLTVNSTGNNQTLAMFATVGGVTNEPGVIRNLRLDNVTVTTTHTNTVAGGLVGVLRPGSEISKTHVSGSIVLESTGARTGLIVGDLLSGTVNYSSSSGTVDGSSTGAENYEIGGLAGRVENGTVSNSYSTATVKAKSGNNQIAGGLVGVISDTTVTNSFSSGPVEGSDSVGGLIGVGLNTNTVSDSFWDTETSTQNQSAGGTGKTTTEMKQLATYTDASWAIVSGSGTFDPPTRVWGIDPSINEGYPYLLWEVPACGLLSEDSFHEIRTPSQLRHVGSGGAGQGVCGLGANYRLMDTIDLTNTGSWKPIGTENHPFVGVFDGNSGHEGEFAIENLSYTGDSYVNIGLFGAIGASGHVKDLFLFSFDIRPVPSGGASGGPLDTIGALTGRNDGGQVSNVVLIGDDNSTISSNDASVDYLGGLIGRNTGTVVDVSVDTLNVRGDSVTSVWTSHPGNTGGVVGRNAGNGVVERARFSGGEVIGRNATGGIVGKNSNGSVIDATFDARVFGSNDVGGVVGENESTVTRSRASGYVKGVTNVGGLVGRNRTAFGEVSESFSDASVRSQTNNAVVGGLVGTNTAIVQTSYATGESLVTGGATGGIAGGLVGRNGVSGSGGSSPLVGDIFNSYAGAAVVGEVAGGLVGENAETSRVINSYSTGIASGTQQLGGAFGTNNGISSGVYFDRQSSGIFTGEEGRDSQSLRILNQYLGGQTPWAIEASATPTTTWGIHPTRNAGYPFLSWQEPGQSAFCEAAEPRLLDPSQAISEDNPYLVAHPRHLLWLAGVDFLVNQTSFGPELDAGNDNQTLANRLGRHYRQVVSFSLAECDWLPIGRIRTSSDATTPFSPNQTLPFTGTYNGDNHQLKGLSVTAGVEGTRVAGFTDEIGLFGVLEGNVSDLTLTGTEVSGQNRVGVLAGSIRGGVSLTNISVVDSRVKGGLGIGGIAGDHRRETYTGEVNDGFTIDGCTVDVELVGVGTSNAEAGGVLGGAQEALQDSNLADTPNDKSPSNISDCDVTVEVSSEFDVGGEFRYIGGVIGLQSLHNSSNAAANGNDRVRVQDTEVTLTVLGDSRLRRVGGIFGYGRGVAEGVTTQVTVQNVSSPARLLTIESLGGVIADGRDRNGFGTDIFTSTARVRTVGLFELEAGGGAGGLVGYGPTVISESSADVQLTFDPARTVGGLVGEWRGGEITNSKASGSIDVSNDTSASAWGGLVGYHGSGEASVIASYTDLTLDAKVSPSSSSVDVGGLVGRVWVPSSPLSVEESYSNTTMTFPEGVGDANAGAFIGRVQSATEIDDSFYDSSRVSPSLQAIGEGAGSVDGVPRALLASQINRIAPFADAGWAIVPATVTSLPSGPTNETWGIVEGGTCGPFLWWEEGKAVSCQAPVTSGSGGSGGSSSNRPSATEPEVDGTILLNPVPRGTNLLQGATENDPVVVPSTPEPSGTDTSDGDTTAEALSGDEGTDISALPASTDSGGMGVLWMLALGGLGLLAAGGATAAVLRARGRML